MVYLLCSQIIINELFYKNFNTYINKYGCFIKVHKITVILKDIYVNSLFHITCYIGLLKWIQFQITFYSLPLVGGVSVSQISFIFIPPSLENSNFFQANDILMKIKKIFSCFLLVILLFS